MKILLITLSLITILILTSCNQITGGAVKEATEETQEGIIEEQITKENPVEEIKKETESEYRDPRCSEKVTATGDCDNIVSGWEYNEETNKCHFKLFSAGCEKDGKPLASVEVCENLCVRGL